MGTPCQEAGGVRVTRMRGRCSCASQAPDPLPWFPLLQDVRVSIRELGQERLSIFTRASAEAREKYPESRLERRRFLCGTPASCREYLCNKIWISI
jgi:hypothetical protein